jgi:hypothetical protein
MELDELRRRWAELDRKLDRARAVEGELLRQAVVPPARRRVGRLAVGGGLDVAFGVAGLLAVGAFLARYGGDVRLALPALGLLAGFAALLAGAVRQLERVSRVDWSGPVAEIQAALAALRVARLRQFRWVILLAPLMGTCGMVVGLQALVGWASGGRARILDALDPRWVAANYAFGLLFVPLGGLAARVLARRYGGRAWWRSLLESLSGRSLEGAAREVDRWARVMREDPGPAAGAIDDPRTA